MNNIKSFFILIAVGLCMASCEKTDDGMVIEGLTADNYPAVDCSTSASPLQTILYSELLGYDYEWIQNLAWDNVFFVNTDHRNENAKVSGTHGAYMNPISRESELILDAREPSPDELIAANQEGVILNATPIALDAFVFITNLNNPVKSLTSGQIKGIYKGDVTNWKDVGGNDSQINPYVRDANSGSQEIMETLVMKGEPMSDWSEDRSSMAFKIHEALQTERGKRIIEKSGYIAN